MSDEEQLLKEYEEKLNYLYVKANTKSKKRRIVYDLFNFSSICYEHFDINKVFDWEKDTEMIKLISDCTHSFVENTQEIKDIFSIVTKKVIDTFADLKYPLYGSYYKLLNSFSDLEIQDIIFSFLNEYDSSLLKKYREKLQNCEVFDASIYGKEGYMGLTYPLESIKKNLIFCDINNKSLITASTLMHEFGHSFEFDIMYQCGIVEYGQKIDKLPYSEVSSRFFEYAFLQYLKENKIYENDADLCLDSFYRTMLSYIYKMSLIYEMDSISINRYGNVEIKDYKVSEYANSIKEKLNYFALPSEEGHEIEYRDSFIYGIGGLFSIYLYENYKQDSDYFKKEFKNSLINYQYINMEAFKNLGITSDSLINGEILKKVLKKQ